MRHSFGTDIGLVRSRNEDNYLGCGLGSGGAILLAVADGMGGNVAGAEASFLAIAALKDKWKILGKERRVAEPLRFLREGMKEANGAVYRTSLLDKELAGMGTTLTTVFLEGKRIWIGHVGDSRLYLYRKGTLRLLTEDHSVVGKLLTQGKITEGERQGHPQRNMLTNALGVGPELLADYGTLPVEEKDILLLCSDGLINTVKQEDIIIALNREPFAEVAGRLIKESLAGGGQDNTTVLVLEVGEEKEGGSWI